MTEKHIFADVSLPFHVWVKEGCKWVLQDAAARLAGESTPVATPPISASRQDPRPAHR